MDLRHAVSLGSVVLGGFALFMVQPLVAKAALPSYGGTPSTWLLVSLFFQLAYVAGYGFARVLGKLAPRARGVTWAVASAGGFAWVAFVPIDRLADGAGVASGLAVDLLVLLGIPAVTVAATTPAVHQTVWQGRPPEGRFVRLLGWSNAASLFGLLAYPVAIEPLFDTHSQWLLFLAIVGVQALLIAATAWLPPSAVDAPSCGEPVASSLYRRWFLLSAAASALLIAFTANLTMDIAAVPMLLVCPLAVYLATSWCAFSSLGTSAAAAAVDRWVMPAACAVLFFFAIVQLPPFGLWITITLSVLSYAVVAFALSRRLALVSPRSSDGGSQFYWSFALGGAVGSALVTVVVPLVANYAAYPQWLRGSLLQSLLCNGMPDLLWVMVAAILVLAEQEERRLWLVWSMQLSVGVCLSLVVAVLWRVEPLVGETVFYAAPMAVAAIAAIVAGPRLLLLSAFAPVALLTVLLAPRSVATVYAERTFFGVASVDQRRGLIGLVHGSTLHGVQRAVGKTGSAVPIEPREPLSYYGRHGGVGTILTTLPRPATVLVVGLGAGTLAAYAEKGDIWRFVEIDRAIAAIAQNDAWFTYVSAARQRGAQIEVLPGDGRLVVRALYSRGERHDALVVDAFSSDAIPVHLLTVEALRTFVQTTRQDGLVLFHISNRYVDLAPVVAAAAHRLGLASATTASPRSDDNPGTSAARWVAIGSQAVVGGLAATDSRWLALSPTGRAWTDQYSPLLALMLRPQ